MCIKLSLTGLLCLSLLSSCSNQKIVLNRVYFLPEYFTATYHFGRSIESIEHLNEYLLVTGKIDTTSETPPVKLGVIAIGEKKIYLKLINSVKGNNIINEEYTGEGYNLKLSYKVNKPRLSSETLDGKLTIGYGNLNSEYKIVGEPGYQ